MTDTTTCPDCGGDCDAIMAVLESTTDDRVLHVTHIHHLPHLGKWQPYCDLCGSIGAGEDVEADAWAIAERHREIGGFERAPTRRAR